MGMKLGLSRKGGT